MSGISLPLLVFRHRIKRVSDAAWHALCCQEYASRWWATVSPEERPQRISAYPGDRRNPFGAINVAPDDFLGGSARFAQVQCENAVVAVVGVFEAYMGDLVARCVRLNPRLLDDSKVGGDASITVSELVNSDALSDPAGWLSRRTADKWTRGASHEKIIMRFGKMIKRDIAGKNRASHDRWLQIVMLRNALVHAAGLVTGDLAAGWRTRFADVGSPIALTHKDLIDAHKVAYDLANTIDEFAVDCVIRKLDAHLLARELFVLDGEADPAIISAQVMRLLAQRFGKNEVAKAIAEQKRTERDPAKEFRLSREWLREPHERST